MKVHSFLLFLLILPGFLHAQNKTAIKSENGHQVVYCEVVEKQFVKKNGEATEQTELYLRLSVQDYFIKFCESQIKREQLNKFVSWDLKEINTVKAEVEILEGEWDNCGEEEVQSRIGYYVIIHQLLD